MVQPKSALVFSDSRNAIRRSPRLITSAMTGISERPMTFGANPSGMPSAPQWMGIISGMPGQTAHESAPAAKLMSTLTIADQVRFHMTTSSRGEMQRADQPGIMKNLGVSLGSGGRSGKFARYRVQVIPDVPRRG